MPVRVYLSPVIGTGVVDPKRGIDDPYRAKVRGRLLISTYPRGHAKAGHPRFGWCLVIARQPSYAAEDADPDNVRLFGLDLPDTIDSYEELRAYLQSRTVGEIPQARRTALRERLLARGVDLTGITAASTWWDVFQRVRRHLLGCEPGDL